MEATLKRVLSLFRKSAAGQRTKIPRRRQTRLRESDWPLNLPLVRFSERTEDIWTLSDAFQGVSIMGENGSGKTSGSGKHLARKFLQNGFGGLVLCFKTDEADLWRSYLQHAGRETDGRFFGIDEVFRFNFMDYEARSSGLDFAENLVTLLVDIASIQKRTEPTGSEAHFWLPQKKKLLRNAIMLLLLAGEPIQLRTLYDMIVSAPKEPQQASSGDWQRKSFLFGLLEKAHPIAVKHPEWKLIVSYWMVERPGLPSRTRETIDADFTGMFDPLTRGKIGELFGTTTNLTPDDIFDGKIVIINIPVARYREVGQFAALIWAQLFQRAVDRRTYTPPQTRPVFLWEDEAHYFTIEQDALFQTTARSKGISVVRLTQNIPNFLDAYGRDGKHKVDTLLGNHATKIFHRNGDPTTNEWASKVIAKETGYKPSISTSGSIHAAIGANSQISITEVEEDSCPPKEFIGLKNGGKKNNYIVEGILFQSGRLWLRDQRWVVRKFSQL
jgi:TraM recognition site of TraD and TraG